MSIIGSKIWFIQDNLFRKILNFDDPNITLLYIENAEFIQISQWNLFDYQQDWKLHEIKYKTTHDSNANCLFCILEYSKLLESLKEIHINHTNLSFSEDLYALITGKKINL